MKKNKKQVKIQLMLLKDLLKRNLIFVLIKMFQLKKSQKNLQNLLMVKMLFMFKVITLLIKK